MTTGRINQVTTELFSLSLFPFPHLARLPRQADGDQREGKKEERKKTQLQPADGAGTAVFSVLVEKRSPPPRE